MEELPVVPARPQLNCPNEKENTLFSLTAGVKYNWEKAIYINHLFKSLHIYLFFKLFLTPNPMEYLTLLRGYSTWQDPVFFWTFSAMVVGESNNGRYSNQDIKIEDVISRLRKKLAII